MGHSLISRPSVYTEEEIRNFIASRRFYHLLATKRPRVSEEKIIFCAKKVTLFEVLGRSVERSGLNAEQVSTNRGHLRNCRKRVLLIVSRNRVLICGSLIT